MGEVFRHIVVKKHLVTYSTLKAMGLMKTLYGL
jgi:hypothetical protein